jgi:hypothetical protein
MTLMFQNYFFFILCSTFCPTLDVLCRGRSTAFETTWSGNIKNMCFERSVILKIWTPLRSSDCWISTCYPPFTFRVIQSDTARSKFRSSDQSSSPLVHVAFHCIQVFIPLISMFVLMYLRITLLTAETMEMRTFCKVTAVYIHTCHHFKYSKLAIFFRGYLRNSLCTSVTCLTFNAPGLLLIAQIITLIKR